MRTGLRVCAGTPTRSSSRLRASRLAAASRSRPLFCLEDVHYMHACTHAQDA